MQIITVYVYLCVWTLWGQFYFIQMKTVLEKVIHFWWLRLKIACRFCISIYSTWHELHKSVQYLVTCYPIWQRSKNICALPGLFGFPHFPVIVRWDGDQASAVRGTSLMGGLKLLQCFVVCWVSFVWWCTESFSTMINVWHSWASKDIPKRAHL